MIMYLSFVALFLVLKIEAASLQREHNDETLRNALFQKQQQVNEKTSDSASQNVKPKSKEEPLRLDLSDFSDDELVRLADEIKKELETLEVTEESANVLAAEPLVLVPSELIKEKKQPRQRRSKPHGKMILAQAIPQQLLEKLARPDPIIVFPETDDDDERHSGPRYVTLRDEQSTESLPLTESEIDELELRTRIAQLANLLRERAVRGL